MCCISASNAQCIPGLLDCIIFNLSYTLLGQSGPITRNGAVTLGGNYVSLNITVNIADNKN